MYTLPKEIHINGKTFSIREQGDYRVMLDVIAALNDIEISEQDRIISALLGFYEVVNCPSDIFKLGDIDTAVREMFKFINCGDEDTGYKTNIKLIDWQQDEKLITSAINAVARTEIRALPYLHWWTFIGHYMAIGECALATIVSIRSKRAKGKKLEKYEQEFMRDNPQYFYWKSDQKKNELLMSQILK